MLATDMMSIPHSNTMPCYGCIPRIITILSAAYLLRLASPENNNEADQMLPVAA